LTLHRGHWPSRVWRSSSPFRQDPHGHTLRVTELAVADELAAAGGLIMGKLERIAVVLIRGYRFPVTEGHARSLVRSPERDLFR